MSATVAEEPQGPVSVKEDESWVVDVEDPRELEAGLPGYRRRFVFKGEDAAQRAWVCWATAEKAGFQAKAERAKRV
jgi:hypothetical protein